MKLELRTNSVELASNGDLLVEGYVNKTGQLSELLGRRNSEKFKERIQRGAFDEAIRNRKQEIDFLAEHDEKQILASTRNNSLVLREDEQGLFMSAKIAPTSYGKDFHTLISNQLVSSMSFGFRAIKDSWSKLNGVAIRTVEKLELLEVSVVKNPAYTQSQIAARDIDLIENIEIPNLKNLKEERGIGMSETRGTIELSEMIKDLRDEKRDLQMTAQGMPLIGAAAHQEIFMKLKENSLIFDKISKIKTTRGNLMIALDANDSVSSFIEEGNYSRERSFTFEGAKLQQKRFATVISVSNALLDGESGSLANHVKQNGSINHSKTLEYAILAGDTRKHEPKGIVYYDNIPKVETNVITVDILNDLRLSINPNSLDDAIYVMNYETFKAVSKLKDLTGRPSMKSQLINGKTIHTLFGSQVVPSDALPASTPVIFGDLGKAYCGSINDEMGISIIKGDTTQSLRGSIMFVFDTYFDGTVFDNTAVAKLVIK